MPDRASLALATLIAALSCQAQADVSLRLLPSSPVIGVGDHLEVGIGIVGLDSGSVLAGYDIEIVHDPGLLSLSNVTFGDPVLGDQLGIESSPATTVSYSSSSPGRTRLLEVSQDRTALLEAQQADAFRLATLTFDALAAGRSQIALAINDLADAQGERLPGMAESAEIVVVPSPAAWLTLLSGLWPFLRHRSVHSVRL